MNCAAFGWLIKDVFLRAAASRFQVVLLAVTVFSSLLSLSARYDASQGHLTLAGQWVAATGPASDVYANYLFTLAFGVADVVGVFVTLVAASGFLPAFLEPAAASVLLSKPPARWKLLLARCLGIVLFVALHAGLFVAGNGVAFGLATGHWSSGFWLCWPILVLQFSVFFAFAALIAVATRNTVATMLGGVFFWLISWGVSFGRQFLASRVVDGTAPEFGRVVDYAYWVLPKPTDFSLMLYNAMGVRPEGLANVGLRSVQDLGHFSPTLAVATSLLAAAVLYGLAAYELHHQDY